MSNILSLEKLNKIKAHAEGYELGDQEPDNWIPVNFEGYVQLCETAIEYYRRWQETELKINENYIKNASPIKATRCLK